MAVATELTYPRPQMSEGGETYTDRHTCYPDLHAFRRVCKAFGVIGKSIWTTLVRQDLGYTTLCLPPRKNSVLDLADVLLTDGGGLGKLVKTIHLTVYPSAHGKVLSDKAFLHEEFQWMSAASTEKETAARQRQNKLTAVAQVKRNVRYAAKADEVCGRD